MKNTIVRCKCIDLSIDGQGIAKSAEGLVVFVKKLIPGEIADVKITADKKNYSYGIIDKLIEASPYRIESCCPVAYKCGGCDLRHIAYDQQLILKKQLLENILRGYEVNDVLPCNDPYFYRNKIQVPFRDHKLGFYRKYSNDIVEFEQCYLESAIANQIIRDLKPFLIENRLDEDLRHILIKHGKGSDEIMVALIVKSFRKDYSPIVDHLTSRYPSIVSILLNLNDSDSNVILGSEIRVHYGRDHIFDVYDGIRVKIGLKSFYQVNHEMMEKLYRLVYELSTVKGDEEVLDLYCGIGTISLYMARYVKKVTGVEIVDEAISNAKENAGLNDLNNTEFILADASKGMDQYIKGKDLVIVDPPRKGLSKELIDSLISSEVKKMIYVSCNPASLKRDLDLLADHFEIGRIQPVDMFPFTVHVETVVSLSHK